MLDHIEREYKVLESITLNLTWRRRRRRRS